MKEKVVKEMKETIEKEKTVIEETVKEKKADRRKMSCKVYGFISLLGIGIVAVIEILVITKILPYDVIVGGTLPSYEVAAVAAIANDIMLIFLGLAIVIASGIWKNHKLYRASRVVLIIFMIYFAINIIMNMMGKTWLERILGSALAIVEIGCYIGILKNEEN